MGSSEDVSLPLKVMDSAKAPSKLPTNFARLWPLQVPPRPTFAAEGGCLHLDLQLLYLPLTEVDWGLEGHQHHGLQPRQVALADLGLGGLRARWPHRCVLKRSSGYPCLEPIFLD